MTVRKSGRFPSGFFPPPLVGLGILAALILCLPDVSSLLVGSGDNGTTERGHPAPDEEKSRAKPPQPQMARVVAEVDRALLDLVPEKHDRFRPLLEELLKIKGAEGRDNAIIHYQVLVPHDRFG